MKPLGKGHRTSSWQWQESNLGFPDSRFTLLFKNLFEQVHDKKKKTIQAMQKVKQLKKKVTYPPHAQCLSLKLNHYYQFLV